VELNYEIYDKEMLAIVETMDQYRHYFEGLGHATTAFSDHRNLLWLTETKVYDRRQAWWAEKLSRFDFKIVFRPGKQGGKPDALSQRPDYTLGKVADERTMTFLKSSQIDTSLLPTDDPVLAAIALSPAQIHDASILNEFSDSLRTALDEDNTIATILSHLRDPELPRSEELMETLAPFALNDQGFLLCHGLAYVPANDALKLEILKQCNDAKMAGHLGQEKTLEMVIRNYYWPGLRAFVKQ